MKAAIFRHGESFYRQEETSLELADDLTERGIEEVIESGNHLANSMNLEGARIKISSSPFGRTLHTAKVLRQTLLEKGFKSAEIKINPELGEVENFDWEFYNLMVQGGKFQEEGDFFIDPSITNPKHYGTVAYFRKDQIHALSQEVRKNLPREVLERIDSVESYGSAVRRLHNVINGLDEAFDLHILSTHEALTGEYASPAFGSDGTPVLGVGKYLVLQRENQIWRPVFYQENAIKLEESPNGKH